MVYTDLRKGRCSAPGHEYLVTAVTHHRDPVFADFHCSRALVQVLRETAAHGMAEWLAWVVMPDHFHALLRLGPRADLASVMHLVKGRSARQINLAFKRTQRLWQPGFHDRALRAEEDRLAAARYIVANPLRAGLVRRVADYPHWDCVWL